MARPKNPNSETSIAARLTVELDCFVSRDCVREWKAKGYPLDDISALKKKLQNQERQPKRIPKSIKDDIIKDFGADETDLRSEDLITGTVEEELKKLQRKLLRADNYEDARTIKTQISGVKEVLISLRQQEYYVTRESQIRAGLRVGQVIKAMVSRIPAELPQMLVGLEYADSVLKCEDFAHSLLTEIAAAESYQTE